MCVYIYICLYMQQNCMFLKVSKSNFFKFNESIFIKFNFMIFDLNFFHGDF